METARTRTKRYLEHFHKHLSWRIPEHEQLPPDRLRSACRGLMGLDKKAGAACSRDNATLRDVSEHLWYEICMMRSTADLLASGYFVQGAVISNAFLESFVIHARNLAHFFSPQNSYADDVVVYHFIDDRLIREKIKHIVDDGFVDTRKRAGKEIAHLTYKRIDIKQSDKDWNVKELAEKLSTLVGIFLDNVDPDKVCQQFKQEIMQRALRGQGRINPGGSPSLHASQSSGTLVSSSSVTKNSS
jgi:hypothetical protein